ncbi:ABC transporter permease [Microbacterium esteraromaticum]|uniref:ABC transporter permease n=1 Tax=Microbacterium esteraromaticum TaxID=57043 RepID=UPI001C987E03|nr:ABC transporter permease [Microbacterium esteraromaticum]MBY6061023.1 ABC transporter permease [Microbacterium esteraromaticum]WDH78209.1 ABC transporter permease [Microbacterium esteraromaticum]
MAQAARSTTRTTSNRFGIWKFLARRIVQGVIVILIVTLIVFALLHLAMPQGPALGILGMQATQEQIDAFNKANGYDLPLWQQYLNFVAQLAVGDLGDSFTLNRPVADAIGQRLPKTLVLALISMLVALLIAIPMGIYQAMRRGKIGDYIFTTWNFIIYSTPSFFLGLVLVIIFSQWLRWAPALAPQGDTVADVLSKPAGLILPIATAALGIIATISRYMRSATIDNLSEDYVRTARAKGTPMSVVIRRHVVRNSLTPVVAMLGYYLPVMFGGMIVVESLFNYPGMGLLFWTSAQTGDYPVLLGCVMVIAIATVVGSLLADLTQALLNPRTRGELS